MQDIRKFHLTDKGRKVAQAIREFAQERGLNPMAEWGAETDLELDLFLTARGLG